MGGGQAAGLHLVTATSLQSDVPNELFANINMRLTMNQADATEYFRIVGRPSEAKIEEDAARGMRPGRGLIRGTPPLEFQTALPVIGASDRDQAENMGILAEKMKEAWKGPQPPEILTLPLLVTLPLPEDQPIEGEPPQLYTMLGQDFEALEPIGFSLLEDGPSFLVAGVTGQTGKTSLLQTWLVGLAERHPPEELQMVLVDFQTRTLSALQKLPHVKYIGTKPALEPALNNLNKEIQKRRDAMEKAYDADPENFDSRDLVSGWPHIVLVIDDYDRFNMNAVDHVQQLADCLSKGEELGISFMVASNLVDLPNDYEDVFIKRFRKAGCGVLLGGTEGLDDFNNTRRPPGQPPAGLPPGRGYVVRRGRARLFQAAAYWGKTDEPVSALENRVHQITNRKQGA